MHTGYRTFNVSLYTEHLEEASFLYEQRLAYLHDCEVDWPQLANWEERLEAHLDALYLGGELAATISRQHIGDDPGTLHAALRVFCRQNRSEDVLKALASVDLTDFPTIDAAAEALYRDAPTSWGQAFANSLSSDNIGLSRVLAKVIGYRRFPFEGALIGHVEDSISVPHVEAAWALGRVGSTAAVSSLRRMLDNGDERTREASAVALMRLGDEYAVRDVMVAAGNQGWAQRVLALGGPPSSIRVLLGSLEKDATNDAVFALGLLGDLAAVSPLLELLKDDTFSQSAATALNVITGADLFAKVFVPEAVDPDELFEEERAIDEDHSIVPSPANRPLGVWERRPMVDKAAWDSWLNEHKHRFRRDYRWRFGQPYSPNAVVECLLAERSPFAVRAASYEELVVRYGLAIPFEADLPVKQQQRFLAKIEAWSENEVRTFAAGAWYFARESQ